MDDHPHHNHNNNDLPPLNQATIHEVDLPQSQSGSSSFHALLQPVPSQVEVESAIASLKSFMRQISSQPKSQKNEEKTSSSSSGRKRVEDAFRLLQSDPAIQKLVAALATDKAVWDAVKSNETVRKMGRPGAKGESFGLHCFNGEAFEQEDKAALLMRWIMDIASRITELIQKCQALMHVVTHPFEPRSFEPLSEQQQQLLMDQRIGPPLLLAVVTLLIVVVARINGAHCC